MLKLSPVVIRDFVRRRGIAFRGGFLQRHITIYEESDLAGPEFHGERNLSGRGLSSGSE